MTEGLDAGLREAAREQGADLLGVAPVERFDGVEAAHHPASIFPETQSVVVVGKRIVRGCLRGVEEGTQLELYNQYARNWVPNRFLALTTVAVASFLEDRRHEAVPLPELPPETPPLGVPVGPGKPAPNVTVDFADAAVRAGLGEIGLTGLLMTPEFGPLQRVQLVLTDVELEPTPLGEATVCDRCGACAAACPLGAIDLNATCEVIICGRRMSVAAMDESLCRTCRNGAQPNAYHPAGPTDRVAAACMRACVQHLHEAGLLARPMRTPFRRRPPWVVGADGRPRVAEEGSA